MARIMIKSKLDTDMKEEKKEERGEEIPKRSKLQIAAEGNEQTKTAAR